MVNYLKVIYVRALINNLCNKTNKFTDLKVMSLQRGRKNSDTFRHTLIIFREFSVLLMLNNCLEIIKIDPNMSEF